MNEKKEPAELVADLMLDPGFVLVPQDRYEELVRAETERDLLEHATLGQLSYAAKDIVQAIREVRRATWRPSPVQPEGEGNAE